MTGRSWSSQCHESLARAALAEIPKLLTLQDRTPVSPTYGCFDRSYWHYRTMDFPCGMSQEFVLPLALAWALPLPSSPYYRQSEIRRWAEAGIRFAARSAHRSGACDDYFPFEQATGATAFSLFACIEAASLLELQEDQEIASFLARRAAWLARHEESGRLANHEALIVACLVRMAERDTRWEVPLRRRLRRLLSWQSAEGWFSEYAGADPGYLSLTIGLLADVDRRRPDLHLREPLSRAIAFLAAFVHSDGSVGGGYTSRGTVAFYPHGLEIAGRWLPQALTLNERALRPLVEGRAPCYADDRVIGHHLWSWLLAWSEWVAERPESAEPATASKRYPDARLLIEVRGDCHLYLGWARGGAFRLYRGDRLLRSDTGPAVRLRDGRIAVAHLQESSEFEATCDGFRIAGRMVWASSARLTPARAVMMRIAMLAGGRFFPDGVRKLLQHLLVTGRAEAPFRFERRLTWRQDTWHITDTIMPIRGWKHVEAAGLGGFQTAITTAVARVWEPEQLQPWEDWSGRLIGLRRSCPLVVERRLEAPEPAR